MGGASHPLWCSWQGDCCIHPSSLANTATASVLTASAASSAVNSCLMHAALVVVAKSFASGPEDGRSRGRGSLRSAKASLPDHVSVQVCHSNLLVVVVDLGGCCDEIRLKTSIAAYSCSENRMLAAYALQGGAGEGCQEQLWLLQPASGALRPL